MGRFISHTEPMARPFRPDRSCPHDSHAQRLRARPVLHLPTRYSPANHTPDLLQNRGRHLEGIAQLCVGLTYKNRTSTFPGVRSKKGSFNHAWLSMPSRPRRLKPQIKGSLVAMLHALLCNAARFDQAPAKRLLAGAGRLPRIAVAVEPQVGPRYRLRQRRALSVQRRALQNEAAAPLFFAQAWPARSGM